MTVFAMEPVGHQAEKYLVGNQLALVHVLGRLGPEGGSARLMVAQDVRRSRSAAGRRACHISLACVPLPAPEGQAG